MLSADSSRYNFPFLFPFPYHDACLPLFPTLTLILNLIHKIPCPRECGDTIQRQQVDMHLTDVCALRDAACPFSDLGCMKVVHQRDIPMHLDENSAGHLLLAMNR
jgi:hypothetical protein